MSDDDVADVLAAVESVAGAGRNGTVPPPPVFPDISLSFDTGAFPSP